MPGQVLGHSFFTTLGQTSSVERRRIAPKPAAKNTPRFGFPFRVPRERANMAPNFGFGLLVRILDSRLLQSCQKRSSGMIFLSPQCDIFQDGRIEVSLAGTFRVRPPCSCNCWCNPAKRAECLNHVAPDPSGASRLIWTEKSAYCFEFRHASPTGALPLNLIHTTDPNTHNPPKIFPIVGRFSFSVQLALL